MTPIYFKGLLYFPGKARSEKAFRPYLIGHNRVIHKLVKVKDGLYRVPGKANKQPFLVILEGDEKPLRVIRL